MNLDHIHAIRDAELACMLALIDRHADRQGPCDILDVGAGSGRQAAGLAARGHRVVAVDIATSAYAAATEFPVQQYDGEVLPFADASFDVVVSSNVLEHVPDLASLLSETARVLRPGGIALHVLPTSSWRTWTTLAHPAWLLKRTWQLATGRRARAPQRGGDSPAHAAHRHAASLLLPARHGERGNVFTEIWYFSGNWWRKTFARSGWRVADEASCRLFYTGAMVAAGGLGIGARTRLASLLGGSTRAYVLQRSRAPSSNSPWHGGQ